MQVATTPTGLSHNIGNYSIIPNEVLGKGATGTVYRGVNNLTKQPVAVKAVDLSTIQDEATRSLLDNEKLGLKTIKAANVIKLEDIIEDPRFCYIVTQLFEGRTLKEYLGEKKTLSQNEAMAIFRKITEGTQALTHQYMIHRDLKPANVMIDDQGAVKIIDLGYCQIIMAKKVMKTFNVGSPSFMAPEAYLRTLYSQKSDAWALGMILFQMLHGHTLDQGMDIKAYFEQLKNDPTFIERKISAGISLQVKEVIEKALRYQPEERATISALKYQADLYHVNLKQKNTNVAPAPAKLVHHSSKHSKQREKPSVQVKYHPEPQSLRRVDSENKLSSKSGKAGFVSFKEFVAPEHKASTNQMIKMKPLTSLDGFDCESVKVQSSASKGVAMSDKLTQFKQNIKPGNTKNVRPASSTGLPGPTTPTINLPCSIAPFGMQSARQIRHFPPPPRIVKKVTVHYS